MSNRFGFTLFLKLNRINQLKSIFLNIISLYSLNAVELINKMIEIDINEHGLEKQTYLNLINSITGIKPAVLIATKSKSGHSNLAVFSSIVHFGSLPPLIGFVSRPPGEVERHTLSNILETGYYTMNHLQIENTEQGHFTSAKFNQQESEFEKCHFDEDYRDNFWAPYVKQSSCSVWFDF